MNTTTDYLSRYSFGHFCCRVKQGRRLSEFLQKYTDSGTETNHLAGYNILVFEYVKISAGLPLLFIGAIHNSHSQCLRAFNRSFPFSFFLVVFTSGSGNLLKYMKNIHFSSSLGRPMDTS